MILTSALPMAQGANPSPLPVLLPPFNVSNICVYDLNMWAISQRCFLNIVLLHTALWILFDPLYILPWDLSLMSLLTRTPRKTCMMHFLLPYCSNLPSRMQSISFLVLGGFTSKIDSHLFCKLRFGDFP